MPPRVVVEGEPRLVAEEVEEQHQLEEVEEVMPIVQEEQATPELGLGSAEHSIADTWQRN